MITLDPLAFGLRIRIKIRKNEPLSLMIASLKWGTSVWFCRLLKLWNAECSTVTFPFVARSFLACVCADVVDQAVSVE